MKVDNLGVYGDGLFRRNMQVNRKIILKSDNPNNPNINIFNNGGKYAITEDGQSGNLLEVNDNGVLHKNRKIWGEFNDGPQSGMDADTLDGFHANQLISKAGDTMTGPLNGTKVDMSDVVASPMIVIKQTDGLECKGISLYGNASTIKIDYGIYFAKTSNSTKPEMSGKHGHVQGDWATYFRILGDDLGSRGWIFKNAGNNVASINGEGKASFSRVTIDCPTGEPVLEVKGTTSTGGIDKITDQGGLLVHCDSSMVLGSGDHQTLKEYIKGCGINNATTTEDTHVISDGNVIIASNMQGGYASRKILKFNTAGTLESPKFSGDGSLLTSTNASSLKTGTVDPARLPLATSSAYGAVKIGTTSDSVPAGNHQHDKLNTRATYTDHNDVLDSCFYQLRGGTNAPTASSGANDDWYWCVNIHHGGKYGGQIAIGNGTRKIYYRAKGADGNGTWYRLFNTGDKPTWEEIDNKPSTFPPASHTHDERYARKNRIASSDNLNNLNSTGILCNPVTAAATIANNYPITEAGSLIVGEGPYNSGIQMYQTFSSNRLFIRGSSLSNSEPNLKQPWNEIWTDKNAPVLKRMSINGSGGRPTGTTRVDINGYLYTNRLYGAVWNDYAEYFEKEEETDVIEPGDVVELYVDDSNFNETYVKSTKSYSNKVVGVCSDEYGHCLGGNGDGRDDITHTPIGLAGRVRVKTIGNIEPGDLLVSSHIQGVAMKSCKYTPGTIIGKALQKKTSGEIIERIRMIIQLN